MLRLLILFLLTPFAWLVPASAQQLTVEKNIDYFGGDYTSFIPEKPNPDLCRKACEGAKRCVAYTFVRPTKDSARGKCYLKAKLGKRTANKCCVSGKRTTKTGPTPTTTMKDAASRNQVRPGDDRSTTTIRPENSRQTDQPRATTRPAQVEASSLTTLVDTIECPFTNLSAEITAQIPEGWSLERRSSLEFPRVTPIVRPGNSGLACSYAEGLELVHGRPARRPECAPGRRSYQGRPGFECAATASTYNRGSDFIPEASSLDLDSGRIGSSPSGTELLFTPPESSGSVGTARRLRVLNGAKISYPTRWGAQLHGASLIKAQCAHLNDPAERGLAASSLLLAVIERNFGRRYCVLTNSGRLSEVFLVGVRTNSQSRREEVLVVYKTWQ